MGHPETVTIAYWAEFQATDGVESTDTVAWDEWAAMTATERQVVIDSYAEALASCSGGYGGEVRGEEPPPAPDPPAMPDLAALAGEISRAREIIAANVANDPDACPREEFLARWDASMPAMTALVAHVQATTKGAAT